MTKTTTTTAAATFAIGDRVECNLPTGTATGTLTAISKGWYVVELDEESAEEHEREKASVRAASLRLALTTAKQAAADAPADDDDEEADEIDDEETDSDDEETDEIDEALEEAEEHASRMAEALRKARVRYQKTRRPAGAASADCADLIAKELRDYEPLEVAAIADRCFDLPKGTHAAKYAHLNNGQIRMNCGNKIRAAWKKGDETVCKRIAFVLGLETGDEAAQAAEETAAE